MIEEFVTVCVLFICYDELSLICSLDFSGSKNAIVVKLI